MLASTIRQGFCLVAVLLICVFSSSIALANDGLASALGDVEWGDRKDDVLKKIRTQMLDKLKEDQSLRGDRVLMQRARRDTLDRLQKVEASFQELKGERTGYEVSVIAGEFTPNNGEALIRVRDDVAQRFFFFIDGRLYKLVVAYHPNYVENVGFEAFVAHAARRYGRPIDQEYGVVLGEDTLIKAEWADQNTGLRIENKKEFFATYTMAFTDLATQKRLMAAKRAFGGSEKDEQEVSDTVKSLTEFADTDTNSGVVDSIVGSVDIDLQQGRPKEDPAEEAADEAVASKDSGSEKTKKAKKTKKKKKKAKSKRDFGNVDTKTGDDLIIY